MRRLLNLSRWNRQSGLEKWSSHLQVYIVLTVTSCSWLRHCATSRKVADVIPVETNGIFFFIDSLSSRTMALGSTGTEMRTRDTSWEQRRSVLRANARTSFMLQLSRNSRGFDLLKPNGPAQACNGIAYVTVTSLNFVYSCFTLPQFVWKTHFKKRRWAKYYIAPWNFHSMTWAGGVIRRYAAVGVFMWSMSQYRAQLDILAAHIWCRVISPSSVCTAPDTDYACTIAGTSELTAHCGSPWTCSHTHKTYLYTPKLLNKG